MCPYNRVLTNVNRPHWIKQEFFRAIRERKRLLKLFRCTGNTNIFQLLCILRNRVNTMIDRAKAQYIKNKLYLNAKNPKKCWQCINGLIKGKVEVNIGNFTFTDPDTGLVIEKADIPDFSNRFFADIAEKNRGPECNACDNMGNIYRDVYPGFDFNPSTPDELYIHVMNSDIDSQISKTIIQQMPDIFVKMICKFDVFWYIY